MFAFLAGVTSKEVVQRQALSANREMVPGIWWMDRGPVDLVCLKEARRRGDEAAGKRLGSAQARPFERKQLGTS